AIDEVVLDLLEPDLFEVRRDAKAREREPQEVDESTLLRPRLDAAAPRFGRAQRIAAHRLDLVAVFGRELEKVSRRARTRVTSRICFQDCADALVGLAPTRFAPTNLFSHGWLQTCIGVPALLGGAKNLSGSRTACLSP